MDSTAQGPTPLHRYAGRQSPEGYAICDDCGARETPPPEAARPCPATDRSESDSE